MTSATHDPSLSWENQREGVMDYRYVYTLRATIERARKAGKSGPADAAQKVLDAVMSEIDPNGEKAAGPAGAIEANTALKGTQLDKERLKPESQAKTVSWYGETRQLIAKAIIDLRKVMGE